MSPEARARAPNSAPSSATPSPRLHAFADTGGTFTDVLVHGAPGDPPIRRAKVLSTSALRGRIDAWIGGLADPRGVTRVAVGARWTAPADFLSGCRARILGAPGAWRVVASRPSRAASGGSGASVACEVDLEVEAEEGAEAEPELEPESDADAAASSAAADLRHAAGRTIEFRFAEEAPILGVRLALGIAPGRPLPPMALFLATTRATNALLERRGARVAFFVTRGFADLLEIGDQTRPDLFAREVRKRRPHYERVIEVEERRGAGGEVVRPLDVEAHADAAGRALADGCAAAAVALLHADRFPEHEREVERDLRRRGFGPVIVSSGVSRQRRIVPRAETAVVEAFLAPEFDRYLDRVERDLGSGSQLLLMTSAGGLQPRATFRSTDGLLSGPAGGVVGVAAAARAAGEPRVLGFDMGGTSTDAARFAGEFAYRFETRVGEAAILAPALAVETVAAGGGSICGFDGDRLTVGPESAGARPGPACYGAGGPLTLTDVNLLLGRLWAGRFEVPIDAAAARRRFEEVLAAVRRRVPEASGDGILAGFLRIANERMADAVRSVSLRDGEDPAGFCLAAFGGAGGQHACDLADELGCTRVLVPPDTGILSAVGLSHARPERIAERRLGLVMDRAADSAGEVARAEAAVGRAARELAAEARAALEADGLAFGRAGRRETRHLLDAHLAGQEAALTLAWPDPRGRRLDEAFLDAYRAAYGYSPPAGAPIELDTLRTLVAAPPASAREEGSVPAAVAGERFAGPAAGTVRSLVSGAWREVPVFEVASGSGEIPKAPGSGPAIPGPALLVDRWSTVWVAPGWEARRGGAGGVVLERGRTARRDVADRC